MGTRDIVYNLYNYKKCDPLPQFTITPSEYKLFSESSWPVNALVTHYYQTPAFKFVVADPTHRLPEAKAFRISRFKKSDILEITQKIHLPHNFEVRNCHMIKIWS